MECKLTFQQYNEALKENKILGMHCTDCGEKIFPIKVFCPKCGGDRLDIVQLKSDGLIRTFTVNNVPAESRESEVPYVIVIVELEDGPWIMGNLEGIAPDKASMTIIGQKVTMCGAKVFPGDKYSAGEIARPIFKLVN